VGYAVDIPYFYPAWNEPDDDIAKLTQLASLLKQGRNCFKMLLMNLYIESPLLLSDVVC
jgi:hypothetical protein